MKIKNNFNISRISYIHVGGIVNKYIEVENLNELIKLIKKFPNIRPIGNTSKILFAFDKTKKNFIKFKKNNIFFKNDFLFAYSGISLKKLGEFASTHNISGFEYLSSIPGLLGGSIAMNASFLTQTISDNIVFVYVLNKNGKIYKIKKDECLFEYRKSKFKFGNNGIIIAALFKVKKDDLQNINEKIRKGREFREIYQPEKFMTLGSTFVNPKNLKIGKIIDNCNLKGYGNNQVFISNKHANFIIVKPYTNYQNILSLIETISLILYNKIGYFVETEIIIIK